jgi:hypothetical protein
MSFLSLLLEAFASKKAVFILHDHSHTKMMSTTHIAEMIRMFTLFFSRETKHFIADILKVFLIFKEGEFGVCASIIRNASLLLDNRGHHLFGG